MKLSENDIVKIQALAFDCNQCMFIVECSVYKVYTNDKCIQIELWKKNAYN